MVTEILTGRTPTALDAAHARDLTAALLGDRIRLLGPDDPRTLMLRHELAHWTGFAGDRAAARDQLGALVADRVRAQGPSHPDTLQARRHLADWTDLARRERDPGRG